MPRNRIGFTGGNVTPTSHHNLVVADYSASSMMVETTSLRGDRPPARLKFSFRGHANCALIVNYKQQISHWRILGYSKSTHKVTRRFLFMVEKYINWYRDNFGVEIRNTKEIDRSFCNSIYIFLSNVPAQHPKMAFFINFLNAIGVSSQLIPLNLYNIPAAKVRSVMGNKEAKRIFDLLREKVWFLQSRFREAQSTLDPTLINGPLPNTLRIDDESFRRALAARRFRQQALKLTSREKLLQHFLKRDGCPYLDDNGVERRDQAYEAHLPWFFPTTENLCAVFALISMRGPWNFSTLGTIQGRNKWFREFPFTLQLKSKMEFCYVIAQKIRGRQKPLDKVKTVRVVSAMRPWSHPYKLLKFAEEWTAGLRELIDERLQNLSALKSLSTTQTQEYDYLLSIKDDLFLYVADGKIKSLTHYADVGEPPKWMRAAYKRWGIPGTKGTRDYALTGAYQFYSNDIMAIYHLASHNNAATSRQYARRKELLSSIYQRFINVFSASLRLIRTGTFSTANLRRELETQGFDDGQLGNLLDHELRTRWGNGCATPRSPPPGFGMTGATGYCACQNCLDGCPSARWFADSGAVVSARLKFLRSRRTQLGLVSRLGSSLDYDIQKLELILAIIQRSGGPGESEP